jgi:hypothetical protein
MQSPHRVVRTAGTNFNECQAHSSNPVVCRLDLLLQRVSEHASVSILFQVSAEPSILTLEISLPVRDKKPSDQAAHQRKGSANEENSLDALLRIVKRVLYGCEDLCADRCSRFAYCCGQAKEVTT